MSMTADGLRALEGFQSLAQPAAAALAANGRLRSYAAKESLFREGEAALGIFIVLAGEVRVVRASRGRRHVFHTERRGGTLGEAPFFDHDPYPATAIAWTAVDVLYVDRDGLSRALRASPDVALFFLSRLAGRVRLLLDRVDRLATAEVGTRLCSYLLDRVELMEGSTIAITQESLAEELGTVREVVMRALRSLRERHIIKSAGRGKIEIVDRSALRSLTSE
jgi:CRP/FNR family transcriptional regulator